MCVSLRCITSKGFSRPISTVISLMFSGEYASTSRAMRSGNRGHSCMSGALSACSETLGTQPPSAIPAAAAPETLMKSLLSMTEPVISSR